MRRAVARQAPDVELALLSDGASVLEYVRQRDPDVIVLDVFMPGMDGLEACRRLRAFSKELTIAVASCDMTDELRRAALAGGASFAFDKHYDLQELIGRVDHLCQTRTRLISAHVELAVEMAATFGRLYRHLFTVAEVESIARLGLCQAAARFDPERQEPFAAFASRRIRGAVLDEVRRLSGQTRAMRARMREVIRAREEIERSGEVADDEQVADHLGVPIAAVAEAMARPQVVYVANESDWPATNMNPSIALEKAELLALLARSTASLTAVEAGVIARHYLEDQPLRAIAHALGLELSETRRVHTRALLKLRRAIESS